jgi:2,4-dienoyl-CoA reductase-like NADH-dependent reductase (Old Yellow Enzyme family)
VDRWRIATACAHEVIQAVAAVIPENKLLTFRISDWAVVDMDVSLFQHKEEFQEIIAQLSREPIDAISVSTYDYQLRAFGTDQNMAQVTQEKTSRPIMICGKIYDRTTAEDALRDADIVLSAKSMLLNPDWVEDVRLGKPLPPYKSEEANIAYTETPLSGSLQLAVSGFVALLCFFVGGLLMARLLYGWRIK